MRALFIVVVLFGCGDAAPSSSAGGVGETGAGTTAVPDEDDAGESAATTGGVEETGSSASSDEGDSSGDGSTTTLATSSGDSVGADGPVELYRGPVEGGVVPGWDPDAPRPLVMMGREGDDWVATLARIDDGGALSDNVAEEIIVWGFAVDPAVLYDGSVGGALDGWDASAPIPLVMMGHDAADGSWVSTLASIAPDGALGDNAADRIIVWGWTGAEPSAPDLVHDGPVAEGTLPGWNADAPFPLVGLGSPGFDVWLTTLVRVAPDGTLSDNVATTIRVWSW